MEFSQSFDLGINPLAGVGKHFPYLGALLTFCERSEIVVKGLAICIQELNCSVILNTDRSANRDPSRLCGSCTRSGRGSET